MLIGLTRLTLFSIACLALMSFRIGSAPEEHDPLLYDVRNAFVTSRSDIPADVMQRVHHRVSHAIQTVTRNKLRPRVILAIRLAPIEHGKFLFGETASSVVYVRATAVASGDVVAEARFKLTSIGWSRVATLEKLGEGIAQQIISEFRLTPEERSPLLSALAPVKVQ